MEFSILKMKKVVRSVGQKKVSKSAAEELNDELEQHCSDIANNAVEILEEKDRETLRAEDVREAIKQEERTAR